MSASAFESYLAKVQTAFGAGMQQLFGIKSDFTQFCLAIIGAR
jgi:hypothetical protein